MRAVETCSSCGGRLTSEQEDSPVCVACAFGLALDPSLDTWTTPLPDDLSPRETLGDAVELGERVGPYRLRRIVGEGGMGHVYEAIQDEPVHRRVALKRIKLGMDSAQILGRFESERQALALMSHPNIAQVYDAGSSPDGRPYFAMEYIEGPWITDYCDERRLDVQQRLELFMNVCRGIEHAHQKGVIHRDIKPSNVLVRTEAGRPVPKIIDFGVAKAIGADLGEKKPVTRIGQFVGTPEYMSPEQAGPASFDVDTRTDVYSLGVLLYELLTGRLPFDRALEDEADLRRRIRTDDPPTSSARVAALGVEAREIAMKRATDPPSLLRQLRGDLDWISKKALEKDRTRRYGSPAELAADLVRYGKNEPVLAGPPTGAYRAKKFVKRHRVGVAVAVAGLVGVLGFAVTMAVQARRIAAEREASDRVSEFLANMLRTVNPQVMGAALWKNLHEGVTDARRKRGASKKQIDAALVSLDETLEGVNATDTAMRLLDEQVLARAEETIEREMGQQPRIAGRLENTLGATYLLLGLLGKAERHAKRAVEIRSAALGDHKETLESMNVLANVYKSQGRLDEAATLHRKTLEATRRVLGSDDQATLSSMSNLGNAYKSQGRFDEAETLLRETLERRRRVLGPDHFETLRSMMNLATAYDKQQRFDEAATLAAQALERMRAVLTPKNPDTLMCMNNLAAIYARQRKFDLAEPLHREALELKRELHGRDHPYTVSSMNNLAVVYLGQERYDEAETLLRETLDIKRRILGPEHPQTLNSMHNLGDALKGRGSYEQAEQRYLEVFEIRRRVLPPDHPDTVNEMFGIGCVAALRGDRRGALHWLGQAIDHGYKDPKGIPPMSQDEDLKSLRGDPVFEALAARAREQSQ